MKVDKTILTQLEDFDIQLGLHSILCGELLGQGETRDVYQCALNPHWVVKVQTRFRDNLNEMPLEYDNILEYETWGIVRGTIYDKWFAPVHFISDNGRVLIMQKAKPCKKLPEIVPIFFTDIEERNFGYIGKQLVAVDYAACMVRFAYFGLSEKMQIVKNYNKYWNKK